MKGDKISNVLKWLLLNHQNDPFYKIFPVYILRGSKHHILILNIHITWVRSSNDRLLISLTTAISLLQTYPNSLHSITTCMIENTVPSVD